MLPIVTKSRGDDECPRELRLGPYAESLWNDLSRTLPGATLYHRDHWIELLTRAYALPLWLATLHNGDTIVAAGVFARAPLSGRFISLPFSDTCPPLAQRPEAAQHLLQALMEHSPSRRTYEIRGIAGEPPWETVECFVTWALNLDRLLAQIEKTLAVNFRRNLRRASQQPIKIERGSGINLLERFYALQLATRRRLGLPPQPWRFFELAREIFAAEGKFEVWIAQDNGNDTAGAVFLRDGDVVHYKWGARRPSLPSLANHLLLWNAIEEFAPHARILDLGRTDVRNQGLMRFKKELGASASPLPSAFYPKAPRQVSSESLSGASSIAAQIWRRLPIFATELGGRILYRFLG
jgi:Acetyltransferase (GNAT) domain